MIRLNVENQNLKGLLERERTEKGQLADQVAQEQQTIEELQKKLAQRQERRLRRAVSAKV